MLGGDVDRVDRVADEAGVIQRPERATVSGAEVREHARWEAFRRRAQERRQPLGQKVARVLEILDGRPD